MSCCTYLCFDFLEVYLEQGKEKVDFSHLKVTPFFQHWCTKQALPMPFAFLGVLLLFLFLFPQWWQAVGRRPGRRTNKYELWWARCVLPSTSRFIYLGKHDKRYPSRHLAAEPSHIVNWPFPFPLPFGLSLLLLPFGPRGELLIRGGAANRQEQRGQLSVLFIDGIWNVKFQLEELNFLNPIF